MLNEFEKNYIYKEKEEHLNEIIENQANIIREKDKLIKDIEKLLTEIIENVINKGVI